MTVWRWPIYDHT